MTTDPILVGETVSHEYGDLSVLEGVDITVKPGAVTAIVGPNGTGKTTLLRILLGHLSPTDGAVRYSGPEVDRPIGYLPQQPSFRPQFTAAETIAFYAALLDEPAETEAALRRVGLADAADRRVEALSGGMRRLLGIAQSLVGEPPVAVFDEPASGLDPSMAANAFEILAEQAAEGTAVLVSSHDLSLVDRSADRVVFLNRGSVIVSGSPAELADATNSETLWEVYESVIREPAARREVEA